MVGTGRGKGFEGAGGREKAEEEGGAEAMGREREGRVGGESLLMFPEEANEVPNYPQPVKREQTELVEPTVSRGWRRDFQLAGSSHVFTNGAHGCPLFILMSRGSGD